MKCGFLPVSQEAVLVGNVSYHDFYGVLVDKAEREIIVKNLGNNNVCIHAYSLRPLSIIPFGQYVFRLCSYVIMAWSSLVVQWRKLLRGPTTQCWLVKPKSR